MEKILLIGNGPSILTRELGDRIDSDEFDLVCRINRGYKQDDGTLNTGVEKYAGTRCDLWFCSDLRTHLAIERHKEYQHTYIYYPEFKYRTSAQDISKTYPNITVLDTTYEDKVNEVVRFKPKWPSTGVMAIQYFQEHYDNVTIHGFDAYDLSYERHHYFEDKPNKYRNKAGIDHTPEKERVYIDYMIKTGKVTLL